MTDSKIYIDTAPFIYYLEMNRQYFDKARNFFMNCYKSNIQLVTSTITFEEYCVYPLSNNDEKSVEIFKTFIDGMKVDVLQVSTEIALEAARIIAKYKSFKASDSIHLATAKLANCSTFLTNDHQLRQIQDLKVITMDSL